MEEYYIKQQHDYKNSLNLLMKELEENKGKLKRIEVEKSNANI